MFRVLQEALSNVVRHAEATNVDVRLVKDGDQLILEVHDNGKGINKHEVSNTKSLGLVGMKERAMLLGGDFRVVGTRGKGTSVTVRVPLTPRATTAPVPE